MNDGTNSLDHADWAVGLKYVAAHIDAGGALVDGHIGHFEGFHFGQFFAAGDDDRHRAGGDDFLEAGVKIIAFDIMRTDLGADARCQRELAEMAIHICANAGDSQGRNAIAGTGID